MTNHMGKFDGVQRAILRKKMPGKEIPIDGEDIYWKAGTTEELSSCGKYFWEERTTENFPLLYYRHIERTHTHQVRKHSPGRK